MSRRRPAEWYVSRELSLRDGRVVRVEGEDPWNVYAFDTGPLGDHARWWLKLRTKHQRWPWQPWKVMPDETITTLRIYDPPQPPTALEWAVTLALTAWAVWRAARNRAAG